ESLHCVRKPRAFKRGLFSLGITPWVRVTVKNKGTPIPADKIAHVFERFFRADPARSRTDGGTGIRLAMGESIARVHGGRVWVRSDAEATVFAFERPQNAAGRTAASIGE
ncbi:ATP-binding protein, partial [Duodenibacillus massiliensis]|uniref:ATP-binding protein n=1 Tax=Duodenibacillus massiliensis TaxID=1852381 RepID=UPI003076EE7D